MSCPDIVSVRNQSLGQWMHELQILDQEIHLPVLDRDGDNATVKSLKRLIERMIQPRASGRCKMQEVLDEITRIRSKWFYYVCLFLCYIVYQLNSCSFI